jgi:hypothetical protein
LDIPHSDSLRVVRLDLYFHSCYDGELVAEGKILEDKISTGLQGTEQGCRESNGEIRHHP